MKRVKLNKFNRQIYALTFIPQTIPPMAQKMSKKMMHLNYKCYKRCLRENGDMLLKSMMVGDQRPTIVELMAVTLAKYTILAAN